MANDIRTGLRKLAGRPNLLHLGNGSFSGIVALGKDKMASPEELTISVFRNRKCGKRVYSYQCRNWQFASAHSNWR